MIARGGVERRNELKIKKGAYPMNQARAIIPGSRPKELKV